MSVCQPRHNGRMEFCFNDTAATEIYTLSLHDALPISRPHAAIVPATRPIICLTDDSRSGEPMRPRKYFCATMFVAFCDHVFGNSTPFCSKPPTDAVRVSHSTVEKGSMPGLVKRRSTRRPCPFVAVFSAVLPTSGMTLSF